MRFALLGGAFNGAMVPYAPARLDNTQQGYSLSRRVNEAVTTVANDLVAKRFMLRADADAAIAAAAAKQVLA